MSPAEDPVAVTVGLPFPFAPLPSGPTLGWYRPHTLVASEKPFPGRPAPRGDHFLTAFGYPMTLALAQFGCLAVLMMRAGPYLGTMENTQAYLDGEAAPEISCSEGEHILWTLVVCQDDVVREIKAFTTNVLFTRVLRRVYAEQRAAGPVSRDRFDADRARWQREAPDQRTAWKRALAVSRAGD